MQIFINSGCPIAEVKHRIPVVRGQFHTHRRAIIHQAPVSERRLASEKTQVPAFTQSLHSVHPRSRNSCHSATVSHCGGCAYPRDSCRRIPSGLGPGRAPWVDVVGVCAVQGVCSALAARLHPQPPIPGRLCCCWAEPGGPRPWSGEGWWLHRWDTCLFHLLLAHFSHFQG